MRQLRLFIGFLMVLLIGSLTSCQQASPCTGEPTPEVSELINAYFASVNAHDVEKNMEFFADDALILLSNGYKAEGKESIRNMHAGAYEIYPDFRNDLKSIKMAGEHVFVFFNSFATDNGQRTDAVLPTGNSYNVPVFMYFRIAEGKILHAEEYWDDLSAQKQLGYTLAPPALEEASVE